MRKNRALAIALLLAIAPMTSAASSWAQSAAEDPMTTMARARFREGVDFYDKGEFEQARASFLQAYALKKHPAVLLNLAWSCLKSSHPLESDRYFRQFLNEGRDITDRQRADANDGLAQSRVRLGRIEIIAAGGTEVAVDNEKVGTAPLADPVAVEAGAHTVKFKGTDGSTETQSISVLAGEKASARFKVAAAPVANLPPVPAPPPPPAAAQPPAPAPAPGPPAASEPPDPLREADAMALRGPIEADRKGVLSVPRNVAPAVILGIGAIAGYGAGIALYIAKQSAQDKADSLGAQISMAQSQGIDVCAARPDACAAHRSDINDVNTDELWGGIAFGIGVTATVGAVIYWLAADKQDEATARSGLKLAPMVGANVSGMTLSGGF
jgi:hypothetical protein